MLSVRVGKRQGALDIDAGFRSAVAGVTALFGRSGAGKTSIVDMVAGLRRPDSGRIVIGGRCLFDSERGIDVPPEKRGIGYVFQDGRLMPHLTVRANLRYGMRLTPEERRYVDLDVVVDLLGLEDLLDRRPATLSCGEKQRVAIGRALLTSPSLLLMDEPLASLDTARKGEVLPFISRMCREFSIPVLYVSHSMDEILNLADQLVLLEDGRVVASGGIEPLMSRLDLRHIFGGSEYGAVFGTEVEDPEDEHGLASLRFPGGVLRVPAFGAKRGERVRVRIPAGNVALALERPERSSFQNIFPGSVEEIAGGDGSFLDVRLDIGCPLLARVTSRARADLGLTAGKRVHALVKSVAVSKGGFDA